MVVTCEIQFDQNPAGTFFNGQLVSGTVTLNTAKPIELKGITLKLHGLSVTKWKERRFQRRQLFAGREDYLASNSYLLGSDEAHNTTLHAGIHSYNFACQLPSNCPSSFEGLYGYIRYMVKVALVRSSKADMGFARGFTVLKLVDLNYDMPIVRAPSTSETYKTFCCGPCKTEPIKIELNVPQTGYVPGQNIPVSVLVINNSDIPVAAVNFALVMTVRYYSQRPTRRSCVQRIVVTHVKGESVLRNCTRSIVQQLHVPATPPTCLNDCIIQIAYQVEVQAKMKGMHASQLVTMPVIVGNVPLQSVILAQPTTAGRPKEQLAFENQNAKQAEASDERNGDIELPIVDAIMGGSTVPPTIYPDILAPPTYEESVHMVRSNMNEEDDEQHDFGPCGFTPLYPVFDIPSPTAPEADMGNNASYDNRTYQS